LKREQHDQTDGRCHRETASQECEQLQRRSWPVQHQNRHRDAERFHADGDGHHQDGDPHTA
jgi:hypothetical protein